MVKGVARARPTARPRAPTAHALTHPDQPFKAMAIDHARCRRTRHRKMRIRKSFAKPLSTAGAVPARDATLPPTRAFLQEFTPGMERKNVRARRVHVDISHFEPFGATPDKFVSFRCCRPYLRRRRVPAAWSTYCSALRWQWLVIMDREALGRTHCKVKEQSLAWAKCCS